MARKIKITDEEVFQIEETSFCIGASATGYVLNYSADGVTFTAWSEPTLADVNLPVVGAARGMYYKLVGNDGDVIVTS